MPSEVVIRSSVFAKVKTFMAFIVFEDGLPKNIIWCTEFCIIKASIIRNWTLYWLVYNIRYALTSRLESLIKLTFCHCL